MVQTKVNHSTVGGMVVIPRTSTRYKTKYYYRLSGICSDVRFGAHQNNLQNASRAVAERVLMVPDGTGGLKFCPKPLSASHVHRTLLPFRKLVEKTVRNDSSFPIHPLSSAQFVESYHGSKRRRYQEAVDSLVWDPVTQRDARVMGFVKVEKINFSAKADPCPRLIQPRSFRYGAALGQHIKHVEKPLFSIIDGIYGGPTVLKGYDCIQSAKHLKDMWDEFHNPVAIGLDASRFDQHCSPELLQWEHDTWLQLVADKSAVRKLLSWQLQNDGRIYLDDAVIKYTTNGCRMSGDMNTSSGNCLIMCAMVYCYLSSRNIPHFRLANNGDDCVVIMEKSFLKTLSNLTQWFTDMGYTMKVEDPVYEFEQISFCQTQPVFDGVGYRMVRDPRVACAKDLCSTLDLQVDRVRKAWFNAMSMGGEKLVAGIPVLQEFYQSFPRSEIKQSSKDTTLNRMYDAGIWRMVPRVGGYRDVVAQSRYSFWLAFGIHPDQQEILECRFRSTNLGDCEMTEQEVYEEVSLLSDNN